MRFYHIPGNYKITLLRNKMVVVRNHHIEKDLGYDNEGGAGNESRSIRVPLIDHWQLEKEIVSKSADVFL